MWQLLFAFFLVSILMAEHTAEVNYVTSFLFSVSSGVVRHPQAYLIYPKSQNEFPGCQCNFPSLQSLTL